MSISPQLRQVFAEVLNHEAKYFKMPDNTYDKDGLLASVINTLESTHPHVYAALARESVLATGRNLMIGRFRTRLGRFRRKKSGNLTQGSFYLEIPDDGGIFHLKEITDAMLKELERKYAYHEKMIDGHRASRDWLGTIITEMKAQHLSESDTAGEVLEAVGD